MAEKYVTTAFGATRSKPSTHRRSAGVELEAMAARQSASRAQGASGFKSTARDAKARASASAFAECSGPTPGDRSTVESIEKFSADRSDATARRQRAMAS